MGIMLIIWKEMKGNYIGRGGIDKKEKEKDVSNKAINYWVWHCRCFLCIDGFNTSLLCVRIFHYWEELNFSLRDTQIICILKSMIHQRQTNTGSVFVAAEVVCVSGSLHTLRFCWWSRQERLFQACLRWTSVKQPCASGTSGKMLGVVIFPWCLGFFGYNGTCLSWSLLGGGEQRGGRITWHCRRIFKI